MKVQEISTSKIEYNGDYVRFQSLEKSNKYAWVREISELADNIKAIGLINPITVISTAKDKYMVVAGNRRLAACKTVLRMKTIPCNVVEEDAFEIAFSENINRVDLTDIEKGGWINKAVIHYSMQEPFKKSKKPVDNVMQFLSKKLGRSTRTLYDWRKLAAVTTDKEKADVKAGTTKASKLGKQKQKERVATGKAKTRKINPLAVSGKFYLNIEKKFLKQSDDIIETLKIISDKHKEFHQRKKVIACIERLQRVMSVTARYFAGVK